MARAKGSRVSAGQSSAGQGKPSRVKVKLSLDPETVRRLKLEAFGRDCPVGLVVDEMVAAAPRRFVLMDRARGSQGAEVQGSPAAEGVQAAQGAVRALGLHSSEVA